VSDPLPVDDGWRRLHPLSPIIRGGLFVVVLFGIAIANLRDRLIGLFVSDDFTDETQDVGDLVTYLAAQGLLLLFVLILFVAVALIIFFSWLAWRFRTFRVTSEAVEERSGIISRQHRRAPLERIQSVNLQRPLLARMLGLTEVDVQTAGQGGKVALRYLSHAHAKELREQILRVRAMTQEAAQAADGAAPPEIGETAIGTEAAVGAPAAAEPSPIFPNAKPGSLQASLDRRASDFVDFDIDAVARETGSVVRVPVGRLLGSIALGWGIIIPLLFAVASLVLGIMWHPGALTVFIPMAITFFTVGFSQFNKGFGFTLSRSGDRIRVGSGLTATNTETVPLRRIHAIEARQPLGWRPFGWWRISITTAGHSVSQGGQNRLQNVVLPVGFTRDVARVFETLGFSDPSSGEATLLDALIGPGTGYTTSGPRSGWVLWFGRKRAGIRIESGNAEDGASRADAGMLESLRIRRGVMTRSLSVMPIVRAQSVQLRRPLVHRMLGLASVQAHTVMGPVNLQMRGLALDQARTVFAELAAEVVRVQAAEAETERAES